MVVKIKRVFNNNSVLAVDNTGCEKVFFGNGIGFKASASDPVNMDKVEKTFVYEKKEDSSRLSHLLSNVPEDIVSISFQIIEMCQKHIKTAMSDYIYVTLTDHLNFAIEMHDKDQVNPNMIMWEIKRYYPKEFKLGLKAIDYIEHVTGKRLSEFEAGHIALHLINAQLSGSDITKNNVVEITKKINDIMNIIKYEFNVVLDDTSFDYERFIYHLKYLLSRLQSGEKKTHTVNAFLLEQVVDQYPKEHKCLGKIEKYLGQSLDIDESLYLTMHIIRIVSD